MKHLIATALLLTFVGAVLFFAPAGDANARTLMPQNSNSSMTMQGEDHHSMHSMQRKLRRHHRKHQRHQRRHHRRHHNHMSNSNSQ